MAYTTRDLNWDSENRQWRYPNGRAVSQRALDGIIKRNQANYLRDIVEYTNRYLGGVSGNYQYRQGTISLSDWERFTAEAIRDAHVSAYQFGRGGKENTPSAYYLDVANELRQNQYPYFRQLVQDLRDGKLSRKQLDQRLAAYIRASKISYEKGKGSYKQEQYAVRKINDKAENCPDCIRYAAMGVVPANQLPLPMTACQCKTNCKCTIYYGSKESLLKMQDGWLR